MLLDILNHRHSPRLEHWHAWKNSCRAHWGRRDPPGLDDHTHVFAQSTLKPNHCHRVFVSLTAGFASTSEGAHHDQLSAKVLAPTWHTRSLNLCIHVEFKRTMAITDHVSPSGQPTLEAIGLETSLSITRYLERTLRESAHFPTNSGFNPCLTMGLLTCGLPIRLKHFLRSRVSPVMDCKSSLAFFRKNCWWKAAWNAPRLGNSPVISCGKWPARCLKMDRPVIFDQTR